MQYIEFSNKGEIDANAFKLLGASTKRGDQSKIGFFGTGLKYALAVLLREKVPVKVFIGSREMKIDLHRTKFGGNEIDVVTIDGDKTSLTTDAGIDWELWFAIREIYSNTLDENGEMKMNAEVSPKAGATKIYVGEESLKDIFDNWTEYFCQSRESLYEDHQGRILAKKGKDYTVFRKGIRVYKKPTTSLFDYDINKIEINESRVAKNIWEPYQRSCELLASCNSKAVLTDFINSESDVAEKSSEFWTYMYDFTLGKDVGFSDAWVEVLRNKRVVSAEFAGFYGITSTTVLLPDKLVKRLAKQFRGQIDIAGTGSEQYKIIDDADKSALDEPLRIFANIGLNYDKDNIFIGEFKDKDCGGVYDEYMDRIVIAQEYVTPSGRGGLAAVLLEEIAHAKSGASDNTRAFQNYLLGIICSLSSELDRVSGGAA